MDGLRPAARLYLVTLVVAALGALLLALAHTSLPSSDRLGLAVALAGATLLAQLFPLHLSPKTKLYLDSAVLVAAVILFEPGVAALVMGTGVALAHLLRRQSWAQTCFNTAQMVLLAATGSGLLAAVGWRTNLVALELDQPGPVVLALVVGVGLLLSSALLVATMVALQLGESLPAHWRQALVPADPAEGASQLGQVGLGVLVAAIASAHGWMVALALLPAGSAFRALAYHVRLRRQAEAQLVYRAYHDALTDLPNRAHLLDRLEYALGHAGHRGELVAVLFLDLDRFKLVNDRLGHATGDCLLVAVAKRLQQSVRRGDLVARLGGDEFTVLLTGLADAAAAEQITAGLVAALEAPFVLDGQEVAVTASVGVAIAEPEQPTTPVDLLHDADVAMYQAKARGKARYELFVPAAGDGVRERAALIADLRLATEGEIQLVYQPVIDLATGRIVAAEALARWEHPDYGGVPPERFIPLAEETGLIVPLGRRLLDEACRQGATWQAMLPTPPVVAVNLSPCQFQYPGLVDDVGEVLRATGLRPDLLALEITEGAMIGTVGEAMATLRQLKGLGVKLAIDDFGTGYSSLAYLQRLPFDQLKVDRQFVAGLGRTTGDEAIVTAVVGMAGTLGLAVVAEGVETAEQATWLRAVGCPLGQGFYFGRPQPAIALTALLEKVTFVVGQRRRAG
jgi:diguanylate cyclase (GGDEF)-like protein